MEQDNGTRAVADLIASPGSVPDLFTPNMHTGFVSYHFKQMQSHPANIPVATPRSLGQAEMGGV